MGYSARKHEVLFDRQIDKADLLPREWAALLGHKAVGRYRTKRVEAGDYIEYESFPVWQWRREASRARRAQPTEQAQRNLNQANSRKRMVRLTNTNFTPEDLFITLTYAGIQPTTLAEAKKDVQAFIRRVKRRREKDGLPELKYIYCVEYAKDGRKARVHHHIVMSGMDRDTVEQLWGKGRANANKLQPDEYGFEGLTRYMTKTQGQRAPGERLWSCSRNLEEPKVTYSDRRLSKRAIEKGIADDATLRAAVERLEPDCIVNDITIKRSDYVSGVYTHIRMRRVRPREKPPGPPDGGAKARKGSRP